MNAAAVEKTELNILETELNDRTASDRKRYFLQLPISYFVRWLSNRNIMHAFRKYLLNYVKISPAEWEQIWSVSEAFRVSKNQWVLEEGRICKHLYFVESGLLRFSVIADGIDRTKYFTFPPYLFTAQRSYNSQRPSAEGIQALEDTCLFRIPKKEADQLLALPVWSTFVRKLVQEVQYYTDQLYVGMQTDTAMVRYEQLMLKKPEYLQRIPQKHLASYLGIAPQSLSRIKALLQEKLT